jgi:hypothetical protein
MIRDQSGGGGTEEPGNVVRKVGPLSPLFKADSPKLP